MNRSLFIRKPVCLFFLFLLCKTAAGQQQFEKKIDIDQDKVTFKTALDSLIKTQPNLSKGLGLWSLPIFTEKTVTLHERQVTFDEAITKLLQQQDYFKDYLVEDRGKYGLDFYLMRDAIPREERFFVRNKFQEKFYHAGDRLPDSSYTISNYRSPSVRLSDIKKDLIILDLWGVNCGGCIQAMPKLQRLQQQFNKNIQIIMVTKDSRFIVGNKKKDDRTVRTNALPSITGENILASLFENQLVPVQVWIDKTGEIVYVTDRPVATETTIKDFLAGKRMELKELKDTLFDLKQVEPAYVSLNNIYKNDVGLVSFLTEHKDDRYDYSFHSNLFLTDSTKSVRQLGTDFTHLYRLAYGKTGEYGKPAIRVLKEFANPTRYDFDRITRNNYYDFEFITKNRSVTTTRFLQMMQLHLDAYFNLQSQLEKRKVPVFVLESTGKHDKMKSREKEWDIQKIDHEVMVQKIKFGNLIKFITIRRTNLPPLIDRSGIDPDMMIDMEINVDFDGNLAEVNKTLAPYGLMVKVEEREEECIVLKDNKAI